ncbi:hypothetical protein [Priestia megaterium]|uniref:hypothetical protein n=1 Tax=Priestia megaterium TaxID=1404 RepID=UPI0031FBB62A
MHLQREELEYVLKVTDKLNRVKGALNYEEIPSLSQFNPSEWHEYIVPIRRILGNLDNDISFISCLLIKEFLIHKHHCNNLNVALKAQGAAGLDVDEITKDGKRIIGELKTTYPYLLNDLGGQQRENFKKDFEKLANTEADYKYFFLTETKTFDIVRIKYKQHLKGLNLVLLPQALVDTNYIVQY